MARADEMTRGTRADKGGKGGMRRTRQPQKGDDNDEQEMTHHLPPASQATAHGVDCGWDNNSQ